MRVLTTSSSCKSSIESSIEASIESSTGFGTIQQLQQNFHQYGIIIQLNYGCLIETTRTMRRKEGQFSKQCHSYLFDQSHSTYLMVLRLFLLSSLSLFPAAFAFQLSRNHQQQRSLPNVGVSKSLPRYPRYPVSREPSAVFASTVVPHPTNRNQHVEFWNDYLQGVASSTPFRSPGGKNLNQSLENKNIYQQQQQLADIWLPQLAISAPVSSSSIFDNASCSGTQTKPDSTTPNGLMSPEELSYLERKEQWAAKYTSVDALRKTFGTNRNVLWGDLDAKTTRRLYKTLLPRALLELHCNAVERHNTALSLHPEDLAPLAYKARVAAKMYARERCELPARIAANLYDGFRQWKRYGHFNCKGMSYQQLWEKYASVILHDAHKNKDDLTMEDVTAKICLKILERSCQTNAMVDNLVKYTEATSNEDIEDLKFITAQLEADARNLLRPFESGQEHSESIFSSSDLLLDKNSDMPCCSNNVMESIPSKECSAFGTFAPSAVSPTLSIKRKNCNTMSHKTKLNRDREFQQQKLRLIRSILRLKRRFERLQHSPRTRD